MQNVITANEANKTFSLNAFIISGVIFTEIKSRANDIAELKPEPKPRNFEGKISAINVQAIDGTALATDHAQNHCQR